MAAPVSSQAPPGSPAGATTRRGHAARTFEASSVGERVASEVGAEERWLGRLLEDRYRIDEPLGEGGMACVYSAFHLGLQQPVAVKLLKPELRTDPLVVDRFLAEAQLTARLRGPHVVRVLDTGNVGDPCCPFIVMEQLNGRDLERVLADCGQLPAEQAVELLIQACSALAEAHALGIIHRDIKPANLFWAELGEGMSLLKVLDFGVCKHIARRDRRTLPGGCVGSPHYMAPEQIVEPSQVDERADIWALGVVLFEMLSGRVPFAGETPQEVCASVLRDDVVSLRDAGRAVPLPLSRVVAGCLRKDRSERYRSVRELAQALQEALWAVQAGEGAQTTCNAASKTLSPRLERGLSSEEKSRVEASTPPAALSLAPPGKAPPSEASLPAVPSGAAALRSTVVPGAAPKPPTVVSVALAKVHGGSGFRSWLGTSPTQPGGGAAVSSGAEPSTVRQLVVGGLQLSARAAFTLGAMAAGLLVMVASILLLGSARDSHENTASSANINAARLGVKAVGAGQAGPARAELEPAGLEKARSKQTRLEPMQLERHEHLKLESTALEPTDMKDVPQATGTSAERIAVPMGATSLDLVAPPGGGLTRTKRIESDEVDPLAGVATTPRHEAPPEGLDQLLSPWGGR